MTAKRKILIMGAGIGGLTTAIALRQAGFEVEVFERAKELKEIGAGIALSTNATRVLKRLGLVEQVTRIGTIIETLECRKSNGRTLSRMLLRDLADPPSFCLHRADLQQVLYSALPSDCVRLGKQFVNLEQTGHDVTAHFGSGRAVSGDALVGADGLRSRVRAQLIGDGEPVYRGYQCWRGVCSIPGGGALTETLGRGVRVGLVPIGDRGTAWWCSANEPEHAADTPGGAKAKLLGWLGAWHEPIPNVIRATDERAIIKNAMYDRQPLKRWSVGRCTLLGDAAHPTTPNMGQGGCMAIEDAVVLARCLSSHADPSAAFGAYERLRRGRTATVTRFSRYYGVIGQWKNPVAVAIRNALFRLGTGKAATRNYARFVRYDPYEIPLKG